MAELFKASNGINIKYEDGYIQWSDDEIKEDFNFDPLSPVGVALEEWYLHKRDKDLKRWRYSDSIVVYKHKHGVYVVDESTGDSYFFSPPITSVSEPWKRLKEAARAFYNFEHKPWHDAEAGEVWVITFGGNPEPFITTEDDDGEVWFQFGDVCSSTSNPAITGGRRLWPSPLARTQNH